MKDYKNRKKLKFLLSLFVVAFITSCQKVINIDLNSASPAIVIIGNVNDQPGPYTVTLSQTVNFNEPNTFPSINGAFISIADNAGTIDTLTETLPGTYNTHKLMGVAGRTYTLKVIANGQTYTSSSTMPQVVTFDTLMVVQRIGFRDTTLAPEVGFQDPAIGSHYYRFIESITGSALSKIFVIDDQYSSGRYINYTLRSDSGLVISNNVTIEMQCIDQGTYQYLSTFYEASGESNNVTPANPISNISNNALGYFSAHTSRYKSTTVH